MRIFLYLMILSIGIMTSACSSDQPAEGVVGLVDQENQFLFIGEDGAAQSDCSVPSNESFESNSFESDSLIIKLKAYNQEFIQTQESYQTRGWKDIKNGIKIGLSDLFGAIVGFAHGGILGAALGAVIYSLCTYIAIYCPVSHAYDGMPAHVLQRTNMECVYSNMQNHPEIYDIVCEESSDVTFKLPDGYERSNSVGIAHNIMLHLYSDEYFATLRTQTLSKDAVDAFDNIEPVYSYFIEHIDEEIAKLPRDLNSNLRNPQFDRANEILSLYIEVTREASDMEEVNLIASKYVDIIESDNTLSRELREAVYASISTGVHSISFWNKNLSSYTIGVPRKL